MVPPRRPEQRTLRIGRAQCLRRKPLEPRPERLLRHVRRRRVRGRTLPLVVGLRMRALFTSERVRERRARLAQRRVRRTRLRGTRHPRPAARRRARARARRGPVQELGDLARAREAGGRDVGERGGGHDGAHALALARCGGVARARGAGLRARH